MKKRKFLGEAIKNLKTVGTFTSSSKTLIRNTIAPIDFTKDLVLVEFGAGDGCFTKIILDNLTENSKLFAFELHPKFAETIKSTIIDDRLTLIEDSAEYLTEVLKDNGISKVDHIVSALPLVNLKDKLCYKILYEVKNNLKKDGYFCQIAYSPVKKKMLEQFFDSVEVDYTIKNFPPAFSFFCKFD